MTSQVTATQTVIAKTATKHIRRKTVVSGAAWSVPVISLAVDAPTLTASAGPAREYLFSGISAQGEAGETLCGSRRPGARIRTTLRDGNLPVQGETVTFSSVSGPFTLLETTATTDSFGAARVGVTYGEGASRGALGSIVATWIGSDGVCCTSNIDVSVSEG